MTAPDDRARLLRVALAMAGRGWPVFPLKPGMKFPALHGKGDCAGTGVCAEGHLKPEQRATTDPDRIRRCWSTGAYNVGIPPGRAGLVVVDLDRPDPNDPGDVPPPQWAQLGIECGADVLDVLAERAGQQVPATYTVLTPRGGRHLYFLAPTGPGAPEMRSTNGTLGWHIDTRGNTGHIVAAGSRRPSGRYELVDDRDPVPPPSWLVERLRPPPPPKVPTIPVVSGRGRASRYLEAAIAAEAYRVHNAPAGQRNQTLYVASIALGQLVAGGALPEHDAHAALLSAAGRHLAIGAYSRHQAEQTIASGLRAGAKRPRRIEDAA